MNLLIVGGAGFIGSHMVKYLASQGHDTVVLDNLSTGHRDAVLFGEFINGDLSDKVLLDHLFAQHRFDGVMHFASHIEVGESVLKPSKYYRNNFINTINLLDAMVSQEVNHFIFSSTAAIFGEPEYVPIDERHPKNPLNPYGRTKLMVEEMLADYERAYGINYACLRYFNAAGSDPETELGERHDPETHLIPLILQVAAGRRESISVFGVDYDTPDGTCIRDYVHVNDLCSAHLLALCKLMDDDKSLQYNLGNGSGFSVREVISTCEQVCDGSIDVVEAPRRMGDPAVLVSDSTRAESELGWQPEFIELPIIIEHAWKWAKDH